MNVFKNITSLSRQGEKRSERKLFAHIRLFVNYKTFVVKAPSHIRWPVLYCEHSILAPLLIRNISKGVV